MNCPKCGTQNPDDAKLCTSCGSVLTQPHTTAETVKVRTSGLAVASLVVAILSIFAFFLAVMLNSDILVIIYIFAVMFAFILGIISLVQIGLSAGRIAGLGFTITGVIIAIAPSFFVFVHSVFYRPRCRAFRMVCGSNLSAMGRAMLIYANDYDNNYPRAGGPTTKWGITPNWQADNRYDAFGLKPDGTGGSATISSSLYFLLKYEYFDGGYGQNSPKLFICNGDTESTEFKPRKYGARRKKLTDFWDFGPEPSKHYSYSYHIPYSPYALTFTVSQPHLAVAADRNPWLDPSVDTTGFKWVDKTRTGGREDIKSYRKGNSGFHQREGQNVLFLDNHVYFEKQSFCGVNYDNIYTYWNGSDIRQGAPPVIGSQPADKLDSLLVNEPPKMDKK